MPLRREAPPLPHTHTHADDLFILFLSQWCSHTQPLLLLMFLWCASEYWSISMRACGDSTFAFTSPFLKQRAFKSPPPHQCDGPWFSALRARCYRPARWCLLRPARGNSLPSNKGIVVVVAEEVVAVEVFQEEEGTTVPARNGWARRMPTTIPPRKMRQRSSRTGGA